MPLPKTAYVDESLRIHKGLYVLAAVIIANAEADRHRAAMRALLERGQLRLHWRDESDKRRDQLVAAVCRLRHTGAVVIARASRRDGKNGLGANAWNDCLRSWPVVESGMWCLSGGIGSSMRVTER